MPSPRPARRARTLLGLLSVAALSAAAPARAAGFHLLRLDGLAGAGETLTAEGLPAQETGFAVSLFSDDTRFWMTFGPEDVVGDGRGRTLKQGWFESGWYGHSLGDVPPDMLDLDVFAPPRKPWLTDHGWSRIGGDATTRRRFVIDGSRHLLLSLPGLFGLSPRSFHFGPSAGLGLNLTWWRHWRDHAEQTVTTGKLTAEAGWMLGFTLKDVFYAQGRATGHYDLFGRHQVNLGAAGLTGVYLGPAGYPLGLEVRGEWDRGDDTVTTLPATTWTVLGALYWKVPMSEDPPMDEEDLERLLELLQEREDTAAPLEPPAEPPPG